MCKNYNSSNRSLVTTLVVLAICLVIVTGSTFSLFTSNTGVNIAVTAGNVEFEAKINNALILYSMDKVQTDTFENGGTAELTNNNQTLTLTNITPGDKVELTIDLANKSNVKTAYRVIWTLGEDSTLTALKAYIKTVDENNDEILTPITSGTSQWYYLDANATAASTTLVIELPATAGNDQMKNVANISFAVEAVQANGTGLWKSDAYVNDAEGLQAAIDAGATEITLNEDIVLTNSLEIPAPKATATTYSLRETPKAITLDLNGKTITAGADGYVVMNDKGSTLVINDTNGNGTVVGVVYTEIGKTTINGGTYNAVEGEKFVLLNSAGTLVINQATVNGGTSYPIYSYDAGNSLVINDATVNATFGCINAYGLNGTVEINGGTFNMTGVAGKTSHIAYFSNVDVTINGGSFNKVGDINMSGTGGGGICAIYGAKLTINGGSISGDYADVYNWGGTNANGRAVEITVTGGNFKFNPSAFVATGFKAVENADGTYTAMPDGFELVSNGLYKKANTYNVYNVAGFEAMHGLLKNRTAGQNVVINIMADLNCEGFVWTTVDSHVDFGCSVSAINGNGYTISNLTINGQAMFRRFAGSGDVTISNLTFDGAKVNSNEINTAIIVVQTYQNLFLDNVDVKNSSITGGYKVATLIGTVYNESSSSITATLKNCDVDNCTVTSVTYDFMTCGMVAFVYASDNDKIEFENCTVSNVTLTNKGYVGYNANAFVYTTGSNSCYNEAEGVTVTNCKVAN